MSALAPPRRLLRAGVAQMRATDDRDANFRCCARLCAAARDRGCALLCLPECFHFIGGGSTCLASGDIAEPLTGPTIARFKALAVEHGLTLALGGFQEAVDGAGTAAAAAAASGGGGGATAAAGAIRKKVYNTHLVISAAGEIVAAYRKLHLFDYKDGGLVESNFTTAGDTPCVTPLGEYTLGLSTCYDLRFPALYQLLRAMGAHILLVPAAFTLKTGRAHWHTLLRARAIETQSYVLAAAQVGQHTSRRASFGHAMIVDPWGTVVAEAKHGFPVTTRSDAEEEEVRQQGQVVVADLDLGLVNTIRSKMPITDHMRPDVYGSPLEAHHRGRRLREQAAADARTDATS